MKSILFTLLLFTFYSCDYKTEDTRPIVEYRVTSENGLIPALIKFKGYNGQMATAGITGNEWKQSIRVKMPFTAELQVQYNNTSGSAKGYLTEISSNGNTLVTQEFSVPSGMVKSDTLTAVVP